GQSNREIRTGKAISTRNRRASYRDLHIFQSEARRAATTMERSDSAMYLPQFLNLGTGFRRYFETLPALDDDLRREAYRIRHSVYCEELQYEPRRPDGLESDEFDRRSVHCLLRSATSREMIGCVRLVLTDPADPAAPFPLEHLCASGIDRSLVDLERIDRGRSAEVSRLAVIGRYRRRKG